MYFYIERITNINYKPDIVCHIHNKTQINKISQHKYHQYAVLTAKLFDKLKSKDFTHYRPI